MKNLLDKLQYAITIIISAMTFLATPVFFGLLLYYSLVHYVVERVIIYVLALWISVYLNKAVN